jgi:hypothetical protein
VRLELKLLGTHKMASTIQPVRKIGNALVSPIGFGAMGIGLSFAYGPVDSDDERFKVCNDYLHPFQPTHFY